MGAAAPDAGAGRGSPRFLQKPKAQHADVASASEKEARHKGGAQGQVTEAPTETPLGLAAADALRASREGGGRLSGAQRSDAEKRTGEDFSDVSVTYDSAIAAGFGANAITFGEQIHFAPGVSAGDDLLGHELTHVAQQRKFGSQAAQFAITAVDDETGLGKFNMDFQTGVGVPDGMTGMRGFINFEPDAISPYSNRIGLIQTADVEETSRPGDPDFNWSHTDEANREHVKTGEGSFVDMLHVRQPADRNTEPWYWQGFRTDPDLAASNNRFGWNRSTADIGDAQLTDFPRWPRAARFEFETVAVGRDNQSIYGAVRWGFEVVGTNLTTNEWIEVPEITTSGSGEQYQSENFDEALSEFRDFYVHEPVVVYFGFDERVPTDTELAKMSDILSYMTSNPDAQIRLSASADTRGSEDYNRTLAIDRMNAVQTHLLTLGIPNDRIVRDLTGVGESSAQGSQDPTHQNTEGSYQANRRVTLTFENTQSTPP